ncbi:MAG: HEAT repeat domain-containing protein [Desulfuromonadaceae bacterium]|nr:HEAT repeat domain-containing protein [Desulfuromonadaceae bacterium]
MITPPLPLKELLAQLSSDEDKISACDDYIFTSYYDPRIDVLRRALQNPSLNVRKSAIYVLGKIHTPESVSILRDYAERESDFNCQLEAVRELTNIGDALQKTIRELVPALIPWISTERTDGSDMSEIAVRCLRNFAEHSTKELINILTFKRPPLVIADEFGTETRRYNTQDDHLKLAALDVLESRQMKGLQLPTWFEKALIATENSEVQEKLIRLAGYFKEKSLVPTLVKMLEDSGEEDLHEAIASALGDIGDNRAIKPLIKTLKRAYWDVDVKMAALDALENFSDSESVRDAIATQLSLDPSDLSERAAEILYECEDGRAVEYVLNSGTVEDDWAVDEVIKTLNTYPDHNEERYEAYICIRENAVASLGAIGGEKALDALIDEIKGNEPDASLMKIILDFGESGVDAFNKLLVEKDFRDEIVSMFSWLRKDIPGYKYCLEWAMTCPYKEIKTAAQKKLTELDGKKVTKK